MTVTTASYNALTTYQEEMVWYEIGPEFPGGTPDRRPWPMNAESPYNPIVVSRNLGTIGNLAQVVYCSKRGDTGGVDPVTLKLGVFMFAPAGTQDATRVTITMNGSDVRDSKNEAGEAAVVGILVPNPAAWTGGGQTPDGGWFSPSTIPHAFPHTWGVMNIGSPTTSVTSGNIAAIYNAIRAQPGFTPGNLMCFAMRCNPELGGFGGAGADVAPGWLLTVEVDDELTLASGTTDSSSGVEQQVPVPLAVSSVSHGATTIVSGTRPRGATITVT